MYFAKCQKLLHFLSQLFRQLPDMLDFLLTQHILLMAWLCFFFGTYFANGRTYFANCQTLLDFFHNQFRQLAYIVWFFIRNIFRQLPDIVRFSFGTYFANWRALLDFLLEHTPFRQLSGIVGLPFRANNAQRNPLFKGVWCVWGYAGLLLVSRDLLPWGLQETRRGTHWRGAGPAGPGLRPHPNIQAQAAQDHQILIRMSRCPLLERNYWS